MIDTKVVIGGLATAGLAAIVFFGSQLMSINRELGALDAKTDGIDARLVRIEDKLDQLILKADASAETLNKISSSFASVDTENNDAIAAALAGWTAVTDGAEIQNAVSGNGEYSNYLILKPSQKQK